MHSARLKLASRATFKKECCAFPSLARTVREIIGELRSSRVPERAGRAHDHESEEGFEKLRRDAFM